MKFNKTLTTLIASAALSLLAGAAHATTYQFSVSGDYSASWKLDSSVVADVGTSGIGFYLYDVLGSYAGAVSSVADLGFFNASVGGGLEIDDFAGGTTLLTTDGPQLYTGDESGPISFMTGSFALTEYGGSGKYTLTVSEVSAVPEPASFALLLGGLGIVGAVSARRRRG